MKLQKKYNMDMTEGEWPNEPPPSLWWSIILFILSSLAWVAFFIFCYYLMN